MAVGIRRIKLKCTHAASNRKLKAVINGTGTLINSRDAAEAPEWTERVDVVPACRIEVEQRYSGDGYTAGCSLGSTIVVQEVPGCGIDAATKWLVYTVGIISRRDRIELVDVQASGEVGAFTSYIGDGGNRVPDHFALNIEMPLLHVWPDSFARN